MLGFPKITSACTKLSKNLLVSADFQSVKSIGRQPSGTCLGPRLPSGLLVAGLKIGLRQVEVLRALRVKAGCLGEVLDGAGLFFQPFFDPRGNTVELRLIAVATRKRKHVQGAFNELFGVGRRVPELLAMVECFLDPALATQEDGQCQTVLRTV